MLLALLRASIIPAISHSRRGLMLLRIGLLSIGLLLLTACGSTSTALPPAPVAPTTSPVVTMTSVPLTSISSPALDSTSTLPAAPAQPRAFPQSEVTFGAIQGNLGYPSDGVPALDVYAIGINESADTFFTTRTTSGDTTFTLSSIEPGDYHLVAYLADTPTATYAGGYTEAVRCGLHYECTDHSLITVEVQPGETVTGVEVRDWYAPHGAFPPRPE